MTPELTSPTETDSKVDANAWYADQIERIIIDEAELAAKVKELAKEISADYSDVDGVLLVGVFKGAVMFMADLARALTVPVEMEFMALSSYGNAATSSGTVRIMKDLDTDLKDKHVIVVEDIIDSGLTLSWLLKYLESRNPESVSVVSMLRKPDAQRIAVPVKYLGFNIPNEFVVGYGLDYAERYRELPFIGVVKPEVYT